MPEMLPLHQKCTRSATATPEVLPPNQKCFHQTESTSSKPEVLPPNRKCFCQTGSTFPILEVHLNCLRQTGNASKVLPLNRKCTKCASAEPEVPQMCFCHQLSVRPWNFSSTFRAAMGLYIKLFQLSLRPGTICKLPSTFCAAAGPSQYCLNFSCSQQTSVNFLCIHVIFHQFLHGSMTFRQFA